MPKLKASGGTVQINIKHLEAFLWNADIAGDIARGQLQSIKQVLIELLGTDAFQKSRSILCRIYQLLTDVEQLDPSKVGVTAEELRTLFSVAFQGMMAWISQVDVMTVTTGYLAMCITKDPTVLSTIAHFASIGSIMSTHLHSQTIQRHCLILFRNALTGNSEIVSGKMGAKFLDLTMEATLPPLLDSMQINASDEVIMESCLGVLQIYTEEVTKTSEIFASFADRIVSSVISLLLSLLQHLRSLQSRDMCLAILEAVATRETHVLEVATSLFSVLVETYQHVLLRIAGPSSATLHSITRLIARVLNHAVSFGGFETSLQKLQFTLSSCASTNFSAVAENTFLSDIARVEVRKLISEMLAKLNGTSESASSPATETDERSRKKKMVTLQEPLQPESPASKPEPSSQIASVKTMRGGGKKNAPSDSESQEIAVLPSAPIPVVPTPVIHTPATPTPAAQSPFPTPASPAAPAEIMSPAPAPPTPAQAKTRPPATQTPGLSSSTPKTLVEMSPIDAKKPASATGTPRTPLTPTVLAPSPKLPRTPTPNTTPVVTTLSPIWLRVPASTRVKPKSPLSLKAQGQVMKKDAGRGGRKSNEEKGSPGSKQEQQQAVDADAKGLSTATIVSTKHAIGLIDITKLSQQQAAVAINRSEMLQSLFMDAAKKMEGLLLENNGLRDAIQAPWVKEEVTMEVSPATPMTVSWQERNLQLARDGLRESLEKIRLEKSPPSASWKSLVRQPQTTGGSKRRFATAVEEVTLKACAAACCALFGNLKRGCILDSHLIAGDKAAIANKNSVSPAILRKCIETLGLLKGTSLLKSDVDVMLSTLGLIQLSVRDLAYVLVSCYHKRHPKIDNGQQLLARLVDDLAKKAAGAGGLGGVGCTVVPQNSKMRTADFEALLKCLDKNASIRAIYNSFLKPRQGFSPAKMDRSRSMMTSGNRSGNEGNGDGTMRSGVSLEAMIAFTKDYQIAPSLLSFVQIHGIFWEAFQSNGSVDNSISEEHPLLTYAQFSYFLVKIGLLIPSFSEYDYNDDDEDLEEEKGEGEGAAAKIITPAVAGVRNLIRFLGASSQLLVPAT